MISLLVVTQLLATSATASGDGAKFCAAQKTLNLSSTTCAKVGAYTKLLSAFEKRNSTAGLCEVLKKAEALWLDLRSKLNDGFGEIQSLPDDKRGDKTRRSFSDEVARLSAYIKGIGLVVGAEGVYAFVDYNELAAANGTRSKGTSLLKASAKWFGGRWPIYLRQMTDIQGCLELGMPVRDALKALAAGWRAAPKCAKDVIRPQFDQGSRTFSFSSCYCQSNAAARADAKLVAPLLANLPGTSGKDDASALLGMVESADARFDGRCTF
ncbi:MAG: hypothetical protein HYY84_02150 [Deltaproteobacteria bacterium]|nr:hypothetical protein [Deltaproteobacteria bacterium]